MGRLDGFFRLRYTGKVLALIYAVFQAGVSFLVIKISSEIVKQDFINLSITYAILAMILGVMSIGRDHVSTYVDVTSPYNKEKDSHNETKAALELVKDELEEKKDYIHTITSNLNNTFITCKTTSSKIESVEKLITSLNRDARLVNCGNSKLSKTNGGDLLSVILANGIQSA